MRFQHRFFSLVLLALLGMMLPKAQAQVVNNGPSSTSSRSQVTLSATIPSIVFVNVNQALSTLSMSVNPTLIGSPSNVASTDFQVKGDVIVNDPKAQVQCTVSSTRLNLTNGTDTITTNLAGSIGGTAISTSGFTPTFSNRKAPITITGDLDESTVSNQKTPGTYTGTFTITATLL